MSAFSVEEANKRLEEFHLRLWAPFDQRTRPNELYPYTTAAGLLGILSEGVMRASDVLCLNDSSEWRYAIEIVREAAKGRADPISAEIVHTFEKHNETLFDLGRTWFVFVACFCEDGNLLSQWRGYTEKHDGFALGIPFQCMYPRSGEEFALLSMAYDKQLQIEIVRNALDNALEVFSAYEAKDKTELDALFGRLGVILIKSMLRFKHPSFYEEREWRVLVLEDERDKPHVKYRSNHGTIIPYVEISFNACHVSRVIQGPNLARSFNLQTIPRLLKSLGCGEKLVEKSNIPLV